jgi:hypothetical protein
VKTLQSYNARRKDELSFPKDGIIKNVKKVDTDWWRGDYGKKYQCLFMASYTEEIDYDEGIRHEEENVNRINNSILVVINAKFEL